MSSNTQQPESQNRILHDSGIETRLSVCDRGHVIVIVICVCILVRDFFNKLKREGRHKEETIRKQGGNKAAKWTKKDGKKGGNKEVIRGI